MEITGKQLVAGNWGAQGDETFSYVNPSTSETLSPAVHEATHGEVQAAMAAARDSFDAFRGLPSETRADLLDQLAEEVMALGDALLERTHAETGLPDGRLSMERGRAVNQARLFAKLIREGSWVDARIDLPDPDRAPVPKPDVRRMHRPIGPVVVFGASNFPLAISVIGSDTVSALGAGCPVVVKGHPGHPGTCEMLAEAVRRALEKVGAPVAAFSLLQGIGHDVGMELARHPATQAIAFTGSLKGGRALFDAAAARENPIPVYAEMGSVNPVFLLPGALASRGEQIAEGYVQSLALGVGQFCTSPGLAIGIKGGEFEQFRTKAKEAARAVAPGTMLHPGIQRAYEAGLAKLVQTDGVALGARSEEAVDAMKNQAGAHVFETSVDRLLDEDGLWDENFGPSSIMVSAGSAGDLEAAAERLEGNLTATIHGTPEDLKEHARLVAILERKVGRLIFNGFPTGLEVCAAMHHGGPYPAATHSHFTSVGTGSILRFVRPVCYQGFPQEALPAELQDINSKGIWRMVDDEITQANAQ